MPERLLYYVPLIHDKRESITPEIIKPDVQEQAERFFAAELEFINSFPHDFSGVKVYQDGLRVMRPEAINMFVDNLPYSPHNDVFRLLQSKGATILGTESPPLLRIVDDSIRIIKAHLRGQDTMDQGQISEEVAQYHLQRVKGLTLPRDVFIASVINRSLFPGDVGILFIGLGHQVERYLNQDIRIVVPEAFARLT